MPPSPRPLKCTGRNASVPLKLPGQVRLIGEFQIKGDQRQPSISGRNFIDRATEPPHSQEALWWKASRGSHSPVQRLATPHLQTGRSHPDTAPATCRSALPRMPLVRRPVCDIERRANSASARGRIRRSIITALSPPCRADARRGSKSQRPALQSCSSRVRSRQHDRHSMVATARGGFSCVATLSPRSRSWYGERG